MSTTSPTPPAAVFLSYAREDTEVARRIADALRAFGVEVWFDQNELRGGDSWDQKIRGQIRGCALFLPVISARTQERAEGYFRREWKLAVDRMQDMAAGVAFIVPVVVDATREDEAIVPDEFMRVQWTRLDHGVPSPEFVQQVKRLLEAPRRAEMPRAGRPAPAPSPVGDARPPAGGRARWIVAGAVVAAVVVAAFLVVRRPAPPAPTGPAPAAQPVVAPAAASALAARPAPAADKSIAVLPFANMSPEADNAFFSDGVHEDVLTSLALVGELRVVSRTSVLGYRATTKPVRQIAEELGVAFILEGSVRRAGNKVRVTGQLINAATDEHVWAQTYDRELTDIFAVQSEIARQIAGALRAALSPEEQARLARRPTSNPAAYDLFLRSREVYNREGNAVTARVRRIELLGEALRLDPEFALAWSELAAAKAYRAFSFERGMDEYLAEATDAIERARRLAPDDPEVLRNVGTYRYYGHRDYEGAKEIYERLLKAQPNEPQLSNSLSLILRRQGRWAESLEPARRATVLDPANPTYWRNLLATLRAGRRWDEAREAQRRIVALLPGDPNEAYFLAYLPFLARGATAEMEAFLAGLDPAMRASPRGIAFRSSWAGSIGDDDTFLELDRQQPHFAEDGQGPLDQALGAAVVLLGRGDTAAARARLGTLPQQIRQRLEIEPRNMRLLAVMAAMEIVAGNNAEARRLADRAVAVLPVARDAVDGPLAEVYRAFVWEWTGEKDRALAEYARLLQVPMTYDLMNVHVMKGRPGPLRDDPRSRALLADPRNNAPHF